MGEWILTAIGPDRPGLVDELASVLHEKGANIADSRMVNLRGQFALIAMVEAPEATEEALRGAVALLRDPTGLAVTLSGVEAAGDVRGTGVPYRLRTYAMDQPGIVHRITHLLQGEGINIEELQTGLQPGSVTGTPLFTMELLMTVPATVKVSKLRHALEQLCDALNCDIDMEPA